MAKSDSPSQVESTATALPDLMGPGELRKRIGLGSTAFCRRQKRGEFKFLEVKRPVGKLRYSRALVDKWTAGESTVALGRGSRDGR